MSNSPTRRLRSAGRSFVLAGRCGSSVVLTRDERDNMAMNRVELAPVDRVEITILIDNLTDPLMVDQPAVARVNWPKALTGALPRVTARVSPGSGVPDALIAEPGFSALVRVTKDGREHTLL